MEFLLLIGLGLLAFATARLIWMFGLGFLVHKTIRTVRGDVPHTSRVTEQWVAKHYVHVEECIARKGITFPDWANTAQVDEAANAFFAECEAAEYKLQPKDRLAVQVKAYELQQGESLPYRAVAYLLINEEIRARGRAIRLFDAVDLIDRNPPAGIIGMSPWVRSANDLWDTYVTMPNEVPLMRHYAAMRDEEANRSLQLPGEQ
jgi:hypothetical protein